MRFLSFPVFAVFPIVSFSLACGDKDQNRSIELANEAVDMAAKKNVKGAEKLLVEATTTFGDNHNAWYMLGHVRDDSEDYEGAIEAYSAAARVKDENEMYHYKLGTAYWNNHNGSQAESALDRAIELNPKLFRAHYQLGLVYEKQGKLTEAATAWTTAATLNPKFGLAFHRLGRLYMKWEKLPEAIQVLEQGGAHCVDPDELTNIFYYLGMSYEKQGDWDKAIEAYSNSLKAKENNVDALRQRGFAYAEQKDNENAIKDLDLFVRNGGGGEAFQLQAVKARLQQLTRN